MFNVNLQDPLSKLIIELSKLPGIGEKTATRLAYFILKQSMEDSRALSEAIIGAKTKIVLCTRCCNFTDISPCRICSSPQRDQSIVCVVERPSDVSAVEQAGAHRGTYHVLHGALSPLDGIGPEELKLRELLERLKTPAAENGAETAPIRELILATNPSVEGEATALYINRLIRPLGVRLTKLAHGLPVGGLLEYSDRQTIGKALENRMEMT